MTRPARLKYPLLLPVLVLALHPRLVHACAACYGKSDAPMAQGMNWGILSLLTIIVLVLAAVASFFAYLARRAGAVKAEGLPEAMAGATDKV